MICGRAPEAIVVREATESDFTDIARIYAHHVRTALATFEEMPPDAGELLRRFESVRGQGLPYFVGVVDGVVRGFAYAMPYRDRSAYRYAVEDSIYVDHEWTRRGIATALLEALIGECTRAGKRLMVAVIGDSANAASIGLHARHGFRLAGTLPSVGFKFRRWVDCVIMVRPLGEGDFTIPAR